MRTIAEQNLLLRERVDLPKGFILGTEKFREGWSFSRSLDARRLEKRILNHGWNFIRIGDGPLGCGVGDTSQEAIDSALKLALRRIGEYFNAVEVARIHLTQYPWFFLARVNVCPYRIQHGAVSPAHDNTHWLSAASQRRRLQPRLDESYPHSGGAMPMLNETLISPESPREVA